MVNTKTVQTDSLNTELGSKKRRFGKRRSGLMSCKLNVMTWTRDLVPA